MAKPRQKKPTEIYQIKVTLKDVKPPIWRRLLISDTTDLLQLHFIIQKSFGWENAHLHAFEILEPRRWIMEGDEDEEGTDEREILLSEALAQGNKLEYIYDMGDSWRHSIALEKKLPVTKETILPLCIKGKRACPPEDSGGAMGYVYGIETLANPDDPEHEELKAWYGDDFDPEHFDLEEVNTRLARLR